MENLRGGFMDEEFNPASELGPDGEINWLTPVPLTTASPEESPSKPEVKNSDIGMDFGGYRIQGELGRGGMGVVYKAYDPKLKRTLALKVLLNAEHSSEEEIQRFFREAESAAKLQHPNIVPVHNLGIHEGKHFFTMDFVEGQPLDALISKRKLEVREICELLEKVAKGLHVAHTNGIIHRDLKPANIIISKEGEPKVTDFGLAKVISSGNEEISVAGLTGSGVAMGTPYYEAPEQAAGRSNEVDARADIYALGCILYELLTGIPPFVAASAMEILRMQVEDDPFPPSKIGVKVPADIETICLKCLEKEPRRRYQSAEKLAEDLRRFLEDRPITARRANIFYVVRKKLLRHKAIASVIVVAATTLIMLAAWSYMRILKERNYARSQLAAKLRLEKKNRLRLEKIKNQARDAVEKGRKHLTNSDQAGTVDDCENALLAAQAAFRQGLFLVSGDPDAESGMRQASLAHYQLALKQKNWRQAREKLDQARQVGLSRQEHAQKLKQLEEAATARQRSIEKRIVFLMADARKIQRKVPHGRARSELISLKDPVTIKTLLPFVKHSNQWVRMLAIDSLAWMGNAQVAKAILPCIQKKNPDGSKNPALIQETAVAAICILAPDDVAIYESIRKRLMAEPDYTNSLLYLKVENAYQRYGAKMASLSEKNLDLNEKDPKKLAKAWSLQGLRYESAALHEKAVACYTKAIKLNPQDAMLFNNRGASKHSLGDLDGAMSDYDQALKMNPRDSTFYCNRGYLKRDKGDRSGSLSDLNKAIECDPKNAQAYTNRGNIKRETGDQAGAIRDYQKALELKPGNPHDLGNRGLSRYRMGDHDGAIEDFDQALKLLPNEAVLYLNRATAKMAKGDLEGAIRDYDKTIELRPNLGMAYTNRGLTKRKTGDLKGALKDFDAAIKLEPKFRPNWTSRAMICLLLKDNKGYQSSMAEARKLARDHRHPVTSAELVRVPKGSTLRGKDLEKKTLTTSKEFLKRASYLRLLKRYDEAISDYEAALKLEPSLGKTRRLFSTLAYLAGKTQDWKAKLDYYRRGVKASPDSTTAIRSYARELLSSKDPTLRDASKALPLIEKAVKLTKRPTSFMLNTLALAQFENGKIAEAVKTQEKVIAGLSPRYPASYRKRYEDNLKRYRQALEKKQNNSQNKAGKRDNDQD
jgi:eukaryotic-like serine/threonine-protein kinase